MQTNQNKFIEYTNKAAGIQRLCCVYGGNGIVVYYGVVMVYLEQICHLSTPVRGNALSLKDVIAMSNKDIVFLHPSMIVDGCND